MWGIDYYAEKAVVYSLGNFWFNTATVDTAFLEVTIASPGDVSLRILPCLQRNGKTALLLEEVEQERIFSMLESYSRGIQIDATGLILPT